MTDSFQNINDFRFFDNGRPNLHIKKVAQSCQVDNQVRILQNDPMDMNQQKNLVLPTKIRFTIYCIGGTTGLSARHGQREG